MRLKQSDGTASVEDDLGFNSIKVRLKRQADKKRDPAKRFQFHKGAIKTLGVFASSLFSLASFNSIKVRLKRSIRLQHLEVQRFQFHKGAIKTRMHITLVRLNPLVSIP